MPAQDAMTDVCVSPAREAEVLGLASGPAGAAPVALPEGALVCEAAPAEQVSRSESERRACLLAPEATSRPPETAAGAALRERPDVRPDELVGAVLIEHVMEQLGLPGTEQLRLDLLMAFDAARRRALPAYPGARFGPENPYPDDVLTRTLRDAIGYSAAGPPTLDEAERLAAFALSGLTELLGISADRLREVAGLGGRALTLEEDTDATDPLLALFETVWDEPDTEDEAAPWEDRSDPPADDPLPGQLRQGALKVQQAGIPLPAVTIAVLGALGARRLRRLMKLALPWKLRSQAREYAKSKASLPANTSNDGLVAEAAIRVAYEAYAVGRTPLFGTRVGGATLGAAAAQNPLWNVVGTGLISFLSGRVGAPDILDLELGHVYEIKPMRRAVDGAKQLYGRYLFWLNLAEIAAANATGFSVLEIAGWAARACRGEPAPPFPLGTRTFTAPKRVWTPGPWKPPPGLPLADGRWLVIEVPIPGVICYQILAKKPDGQADPVVLPDPSTVAKILIALMMAWAAVKASEQKGRGGAQEAARWMEIPFPSPAEQRPGVDPALTSALLAAVVVVGIAVVVVAAVAAAPVVAGAVAGSAAGELFVAGGVAAMQFAH